jgi:uncharacterized RDD family membrane protein YckC
MRWRRLVAFAIDWCCMLGWVAVVAAVGIPLYLAGAIQLTGALAQNLMGLTVVVPIVLAAAWCESRSRGATPGKLALGLRVVRRNTRVSFPRALLRNTLKLGLPWIIGHVAVFALVDTAASAVTPAWAFWLLGAAYLLPLLWVASLLLPGARTSYDRLSSTEVIESRLARG